MKTKSKVLLALAFLTAGTIAAASTSTFAWFTTTRSATMTFKNVTVQKSVASLEANLYPLSGSAWGAATKEFTDATKMSEISSGDGVHFVKPIWKSEVDGDISGHTEGTPGVDYTYFLLEVINNGADGAPSLDVYFDKGTGIVPANSSTKADCAASLYSRAAVNHLGKVAKPAASLAAGTSYLVFENGSQTIDGSSAGATTTNYVSYSAPATYKKDALVDTNKQIVGDFNTVTRDSAVAKQSVVANLGAQEKAYSIVSVWLEGTKGTGVGTYFDDTVNGVINITLKLAAFESVA